MDRDRVGLRRLDANAVATARRAKPQAASKAERRIDRGAGRRRVEHRHEAARRDVGDAAMQQARRKPLPAMLGRHQHHADPGAAPAIGQRRGGRDHAAAGAHRVGGAELEEDAPVGRDLVPAGLRDQRLGVGQVGERKAPDRRRIRTRHRACRSRSACRGSAGRARPSPRSSRSAARAARADSRTAASPRWC